MNRKYKCHLIDANLEEWFKSLNSSELPEVDDDDPDYHKRYQNICAKLKPYHKRVELGALFDSIISLSKSKYFNPSLIVYLNKHGLSHIPVVIDRATEILIASGCEITPYECYLLLCAIQFHDVGNFFGRDDHERKCIDIMLNDVKDQAGSDTAEKNKIIAIASAHGGLLHGSINTISGLFEEADLMNQRVRFQLLAALLRLADELAEDSKRADRFLMQKDKIPEKSIIYHQYSSALHSNIIEDGEIRFTFEYSESIARNKYSKLKKIKSGKIKVYNVYLLDEIYERTLKTHVEKEYCMKFIRNHAANEIQDIRVDITVYPEYDLSDCEPKRVTYSLRDKGYPSNDMTIFDFCPELKTQQGKDILLYFDNIRKRKK